VLGDLVRRFLDRDLFKTVEVTHLDAERCRMVRDRVAEVLSALDLPPEAYCTLRGSQAKGYALYEQGIFVRDGDALRELADASQVVRGFIQPERRLWLVYPREIEAEVRPLVRR
jgi:hypothetical protein